ncbi:MAG: DUF4332 domain-containing protein [Muribaculaceae bacterium]|nr:DUF4332 domain-containing protein [Muribaculaceae bacterium]
MSYKVEQIEGIGPSYAAKLEEAGISTTEQLLEACAKPAGRKALAEKLDISGKLILRWTNHADLMRIKGVAGQFAELLEAAGVDTVKEFRHRVAANLHAKMVEVNDERNLCNRVPSVAELERMIEQAKELDPVVSY